MCFLGCVPFRCETLRKAGCCLKIRLTCLFECFDLIGCVCMKGWCCCWLDWNEEILVAIDDEIALERRLGPEIFFVMNRMQLV